MQSNNPKLAGFDWRGFAAAVERKRRADNLSVRALAALIGLTGKDISMASGGHVVGVAKVHALLKWLGLELDFFDIAPMEGDAETKCYGRSNVKHSLPHASGCAAVARASLRPAAVEAAE